jgi:hypothetical protein
MGYHAPLREAGTVVFPFDRTWSGYEVHDFLLQRRAARVHGRGRAFPLQDFGLPAI